MEISPRRSLSLDLDTSVLTTSSYPPTYGNCRANMYTMQGMKLASPEKQIQKSYRMTSSLSIDSATKCAVTRPRKENFFTTMFGAFTSIIVERFGKVPSSFMPNIHNTLSVTVVPNEGILSQEFFKTLTQSSKQLVPEHDNNVIEDDSRIMDKLPNKNMYDEKSSISHILTDNIRKCPLSGKVTLNSEFNKINDNENSVKTMEKKSFDSPVIFTELANELDVGIVSARQNNNSICHENSSTMRNFQNQKRPTCLKDYDRTNNFIKPRMDVNISSSSRSAVPNITEDHNKMKMTNQTCTTGLHTMWHRVLNGMSDRFTTQRPVSPDSEVPTKKPNLTKPRWKTSVVARGRGKKRGKSQLRRSGVSQLRHRKERTKQNMSSNIQDDLDAWEDTERYDESDDDNSENLSSHHCSTLLDSLTFNVATKARKRKQEMHNIRSKCPMRVRYVPESSMEIENQKSSYDEHDCSSRVTDYRPRLVSESSVDSEDSYCIVFENGSESEYSDDDCDAVSEGSSATVSDDDFDDDQKSTMKVRFNLTPQVHTMIKWNYAYRAARPGPWEEMARDRDRFQGRIHCIERILNPILSVQHRNGIWENRFDVNEETGQRV